MPYAACRGKSNAERARNFWRLTQQESWTICAYRPAIAWRRYTEIDKGRIVSGSTTNGAFVSFGKTAKHGMLKSSTITEQTMSIKREDIEGRKIDFSAIQSGRRLPPVHPGGILRDDFLTPMGISVYELANAIKVPRSRVNDIVLGRRAITTDTALRLGRYFGTTPEFWINLQARYDLEVADRTLRRRIEREISPRAA